MPLYGCRPEADATGAAAFLPRPRADRIRSGTVRAPADVGQHAETVGELCGGIANRTQVEPDCTAASTTRNVSMTCLAAVPTPGRSQPDTSAAKLRNGSDQAQQGHSVAQDNLSCALDRAARPHAYFRPRRDLPKACSYRSTPTRDSGRVQRQNHLHARVGYPAFAISKRSRRENFAEHCPRQYP